MDTDRTARIIAIIGTALVTVLVILLLSLSYLPVAANDNDKPERAEVLLVEEEFVDVIQPATSSTDDEDEAASYLEEPQQNESQPTPPSGTDTDNKGNAAEAPAVVATKEPSPVKVTKEKPKETGPAVDKKKQEEERVKREASNEVANAFKNASGKNNAATSASADKGLSGNKTQNSASQGISGFGSGTVGGGWIIPKYAPVRSTVTGSVKMIVKIDNTGRVVSVTFNGGQPPAATDKAVQAAIEREIRAHKFSRANYDDAEAATAYVTYTFK